MLSHPHIAISLKTHGTKGDQLLANEVRKMSKGLGFKGIG